MPKINPLNTPLCLGMEPITVWNYTASYNLVSHISIGNIPIIGQISVPYELNSKRMQPSECT